jgi:exopolyphosphatase/guanosine-5'-triphosphate,3'-diphosphate pyrophosphatase
MASLDPEAGEKMVALTGMPVEGRVGVVDIGSNTVRLVVYEAPTRLPIPVFNEKALCRLGAGLGKSGKLNPAGVTAALKALRRFVGLSRAMGVSRLELVATAAVRDATDGAAFVRKVEEACEHPVTILTGAEEARLAAVGVLNGCPGADGALADLGGGSLDLVGLDQGEIGTFATLPLGHIRLAEDAGSDRARSREIIARSFATVPWLTDISGKTLFCVGGSWRALARIFIEQMHHPLHVVDAFTIDFFHALRLADLVGHLSRATLDKLDGVDARRVDSLPVAALTMAALVEATRPKEIVFSAFSMREGQMLELLPATLRSQDPLISACESQAERTGRFGLGGIEIRDWMMPLFPEETRAEQRLRLAACLLSDLGWSEHPDYRALHAYHRVLRIPYAGLTHPDRAELALAILIRYGGDEDDRMVAPVHSLLDDRRRYRARVIGLALRLAQTLSGGAPGLLPHTRLECDDETLRLLIPPKNEVFYSDAVERRFKRLARATGRKEDIARQAN